MLGTDFDFKRHMSALVGLGHGKVLTDRVGIIGDFRSITVAEGIEIGQRLGTAVHADHLDVVDKACAAVGIIRTSNIHSVIAEEIGKALVSRGMGRISEA